MKLQRPHILVFDLFEAILFTPPEEYVDKQTGEIKKRQIKYYPDEYKERIGKTYRDYVEKYQMSFLSRSETTSRSKNRSIPA